MSASFFTDLGVVITVAALVGFVFARFNLPMTVGYILAGILLGPHIPPELIDNPNHIEMLKDLGVMFLMLSIGLGLRLRRILNLGSRIVFPAVWDVAFTTLGGYFLGRIMGWGQLESFLLGLIICDSSTSIAAKTLDELGLLKARFAANIFGIALMEDVLAIGLIAVLNGLSSGSIGGGEILRQSGVMVTFLTLTLVLGILFVPKLLNYVARRLTDEVLLLLALGLCFSVSIIANKLELSMVLGAFLVGALIAESHARARLQKALTPLTTLFSAVFFISVGLSVEPLVLWQNLGAIVLVTVGMIILKLVNGTVSSILVCERPRDAFTAGLGLGQVAEFGFIIAAIGVEKNLTELPVGQIAVGVALLSTAINPYLLRNSERLYAVSYKLVARMNILHRVCPIVTFIQELQQRQHPGSLFHRMRSSFIWLVIQLVLIGGFFAVARLFLQFHWLQPLMKSYGHLADWAVIAGLLFLTAPTLWAAVHTARNLIDILTENLSQVPRSTRIPLPTLRDSLKFVLRTTIVAALGIYMVFLSSFFIDSLWGLLAILMLYIVILITCSARFQQQYDQAHQQLMETFTVPPGASDDDDDQDDGEDTPAGPTLASNYKLHLPPDSPVIGKTLRELDFRVLTGATIVLIENPHTHARVFPSGTTQFNAGDVLHLMAKPDEYAAAQALVAGITIPSSQEKSASYGSPELTPQS